MDDKQGEIELIFKLLTGDVTEEEREKYSDLMEKLQESFKEGFVTAQNCSNDEKNNDLTNMMNENFTKISDILTSLQNQINLLNRKVDRLLNKNTNRELVNSNEIELDKDNYSQFI